MNKMAKLRLGVLFFEICLFAKSGVADFVDPMIGTVGNGHAFPGPCRPFGLVQPSPDTGNGSWKYCSGYAGDDHIIRRFSQTHLNGTGQAGLGDVGLLPFTGEMPSDLKLLCASFEKKRERAVLGKYEVELNDDTRVEISAGRRLAHYRLTFPKDMVGKILLDFSYGLYRQEKYLPFLTMSSRVDRVSASRLEGSNHSEVFAPRDFHYVVDFSPVPVCLNELYGLSTGNGPCYVAEFSPGSVVEVKIALSARSLVGARKNFSAEAATEFDCRVQETVGEWNGYLSRINLDGLTIGDKKSICTALYHLFVQPNVISDVDEKPRYSTFSLWDTFRDAHPLYERLVPELVPAFVESLLDHYDRWGYLPRWELWGRETNCMIGSHAVPVIVSAYQHGFRGFNIEKAYTAVKSTLTKEGRPGAGKVYPRRTDWKIYEKYGYFPFDIVPCESVSRTLECAFDDFCAAQFAKALGKSEDAVFFAGTLFPGLPRSKSQDVTGLIGDYAHGNEPCHHIPGLYGLVDRQDKQKEVVRRIVREFYRPWTDGLCGNDDCGQMSAWYLRRVLDNESRGFCFSW